LFQTNRITRPDKQHKHNAMKLGAELACVVILKAEYKQDVLLG
jgi:hypothetical protein